MPRTNEATRMSLEEYLDFEATALVKHEFVDGFAFAMAGASNNHNVISTNLIALLRPAVRGSKCRVYANDMKLHSPENVIYYPDILLVCDEADLTSNIKTTACLIVEILSESTADIDRGEKLISYRKLPSLQAYVLVSQQRKLVEVYRLLADKTWRHEILDAGKLELPCLNASIPLEALYEDIDFSQMS